MLVPLPLRGCRCTSWPETYPMLSNHATLQFSDCPFFYSCLVHAILSLRLFSNYTCSECMFNTYCLTFFLTSLFFIIQFLILCFLFFSYQAKEKWYHPLAFPESVYFLAHAAKMSLAWVCLFTCSVPELWILLCSQPFHILRTTKQRSHVYKWFSDPHQVNTSSV